MSIGTPLAAGPPRRGLRPGTARPRRDGFAPTCGRGQSAFRPNGAEECSHGWSDAAFGVAEPVGAFVFQHVRPDGAADCSRGWSDAAFGVAEPVGAFVFQHVRPDGAAEAPSRAADQSNTYRSSNSTPCARSIRRSSDRKSFAPLGQKGKKDDGRFPSSALHGFRVGPPCGRAAPPVATTRRPAGADGG